MRARGTISGESERSRIDSLALSDIGGSGGAVAGVPTKCLRGPEPLDDVDDDNTTAVSMVCLGALEAAAPSADELFAARHLRAYEISKALPL